jgi:hypothetical protein
MKNLLLNAAILTVCALVFWPNALNAQCFQTAGKLYKTDGTDCINSIFTGVPFLRTVADARSSAMGDAGIAISADANAIHFNASKLVFAEQDMSFSANYTPWMRSIVNNAYLGYLNGFKKMGDRQAIGLGLRYFSSGELQFRDTNGEPLNTGIANEFELAIAYARKLSDHFSAGITGKFIYSDFAAGQPLRGGDIVSAGRAGAADISFTYETRVDVQNWKSNLRIGLVLSNIGSKITYSNSLDREYLPTNLGLGAAWELQLNDYHALTLTADINKLMVPTPCLNGGSSCDLNGNGRPDFKEHSPIVGMFKSFSDAPEGFSEEMRELMYSLGMEYWYKKRLAIRAGYFYESITKGERAFFTTGLGFKYKEVLGLNFSYMTTTSIGPHPLDNTLRFSLLYGLNNDVTGAKTPIL